MHLAVPALTHGGGRSATHARLRGDGVDHELRFEVPEGWGPHPGTDPFVPTAVFVATAAGAESLTVEGPVSEPLLEGARVAGRRYADHLGRPAVELVAVSRPSPPPRPAGRRVALFVSRGVDSTCNLVRADRGELEPHPDVGLVVAGIDTATDDAGDALQCLEHIEVAARFGLEPLLVRTNVRELFDAHAPWIVGIGPALAGIGLSLSDDLSDVIISSAVRDARRFTGAHPDLDPLWGNGLVRFHHLPLDLDRSDRVRLVVEDGRALEFLRVCWGEGPSNCGRCQKCLQTTALIRAYGGDASLVFDVPVPSAEDLRRDPPGPTLRDDFIAAAEAAGERSYAAAVAEHRDAPAGRPSPASIHAIDLGAGRASELDWTYIAAATEDPSVAAAVVDAAARAGSGCVLGASGSTTTHVEATAMRAAAVTLWQWRGDGTDGRRVVDALANGSRPAIAVDLLGAGELRARLPEQLRPLITAPGEVPGLIGTAADDGPRIARMVRSGGLGWLDALEGERR